MSRLLSVSVPDDLLDQAEALAAAQGRTKSELVREALRAHVALQQLRDLQGVARERAEVVGIGPEDVEALVDETRGRRR